jgi:hypothetical protein
MVAQRGGGHPLGGPERAFVRRHLRRPLLADRRDRGREPPRRCGQACWRARSPACCDGAASMPAAVILLRQSFDLGRHALNSSVQPAPVLRQVGNEAHHPWREHVRVRAEDIWQRPTQGHHALPHRDAALDQKAADLMITPVRWPTRRERTRCRASRSICSGTSRPEALRPRQDPALWPRFSKGFELFDECRETATLFLRRWNDGPRCFRAAVPFRSMSARPVLNCK